MKIALISDIHSNHFYLEQVLKSIDKEKVDEIYCLGDIVGYYDKPNETIETIHNIGIKAIKGNHEKFLLGELEYDKKKEYLYSFEVQNKIIKDKNKDFLRKLPEFIETTIDDKTFYITHSLPDDCINYFRDIKDIDLNFLKKYNYYCYGHTHLPSIAYSYGACVMNPGSVGQPRDYTNKASFIILDVANHIHTLYKVVVDNKAYSKHLLENNFRQELINILNR